MTKAATVSLDNTQEQQWKRPLPSYSAGTTQRTCACGQHTNPGGECAACKQKRLQRQTAGHKTSTPPIVQEVLRSPGQPLEPAARGFMEPRFGKDFSMVRVHTNARAAESAQAVNALAFTVGHNIVFDKGQYAVGTNRGNQLLAHELTHVAQQQEGLSFQKVSSVNDAAEHEAELNAKLLTSDYPLTYKNRPSKLSRRERNNSETTTTVTVEEPTGANDCKLEHHSLIEPAVRQAQQWLSRAVSQLNAYLGAPTRAANANVREALNRHFHATDAATTRIIRTRLETIRTDLTSRDPFTVECHSDADPTCTNSGAYVPGSNQSMIVFCPSFFTSTSPEWRAETLIHEMAHSLLGLRISDRAYSSDRVLPHLSRLEALDNAESYAQFTQELGTGRRVTGSPPQDEIEDCTNETKPLIQEALGRAQRWNRDAETVANDSRPVMVSNNANLFATHLGNATPATRAAALQIFSNMVVRLRSPINVRCDSRAQNECNSRSAYKKTGSDNTLRGLGIGAAIGGGVGLIAGVAAGLLAASGPLGLAVGLGALALGGLIGLIVGAATSTTDAVHVCPTWNSTPDPDDRTEALLAAIYETYAGLNVDQSQRHAQLARALHNQYIGAPETP